MSDNYIELLTIGECAKRLSTTSEMGLRYRIDKGEVRTVRRYGRILVSEAELQRLLPTGVPAPPHAVTTTPRHTLPSAGGIGLPRSPRSAPCVNPAAAK